MFTIRKDKFSVYVNHPTNKATVHKIECGKRKSRRREKTSNGFWKDFSTFEEAKVFALEQGKKHTETCALCCPDLLIE
jgi:hypothetical protein